MSSNTVFEQITCPFCALACDDLTIKSDGIRLMPEESLPAFCRAGFENAGGMPLPTAKQNGQSIASDDAIRAAANMLKQAKNPLFSGLLADIQGIRQTLALARSCGGTVDHIDSDMSEHNLAVLQNYGWITATLSEIQQRSDLIVLIGSCMFEDYPRLLERIVPKQRALEWVFIGPESAQPLPPELQSCQTICLESDKIPNYLQQLSMAFHQQQSKTHPQQKSSASSVTSLLGKINHARYPTFIWSAKDMGSAHADLSITLLVRLIKKINEKTRCVGLPLGGNRGSGNVQSTCLWQTGYPGRVSFAGGDCRYDPLHFSTEKMLAQRATDLLVWIAALQSEAPPPCDIPTIALVHPASVADVSCDLVIPVGIPGIDQAGYTYRTDGVVILPLTKLRSIQLKSLPDILRAIQTQLSEQ